jgi:hypothetical protein
MQASAIADAKAKREHCAVVESGASAFLSCGGCPNQYSVFPELTFRNNGSIGPHFYVFASRKHTSTKIFLYFSRLVK